MLGGKCRCYICSVFVSTVTYNLGILLTVNPSTYVGHPTSRVSEWLAAFNIVISFYFLVAFEKAV
jgi:hypothetical protein